MSTLGPPIFCHTDTLSVNHIDLCKKQTWKKRGFYSNFNIWSKILLVTRMDYVAMGFLIKSIIKSQKQLLLLQPKIQKKNHRVLECL